MGAFTYEQNVGSLDYDLAPYGGKGIVPEPTMDQLEEFEARRTEYLASLPKPDAAVPDAASLSAQNKQYYGTWVAIIADLCGGSPTAEELNQLPPRVFGRFVIWLQEELFAPKD